MFDLWPAPNLSFFIELVSTDKKIKSFYRRLDGYDFCCRIIEFK
jgi:hypothetical protein